MASLAAVPPSPFLGGGGRRSAEKMPSLAAVSPSSFLGGGGVERNPQARRCAKPRSLAVRAARLPAGVEAPKVEPKITEPFWGFTRTAETWNARACMIGLIGTFFVELILHKGILQMVGVDVGKGLNLPL